VIGPSFEASHPFIGGEGVIGPRSEAFHPFIGGEGVIGPRFEASHLFLHVISLSYEVSRCADTAHTLLPAMQTASLELGVMTSWKWYLDVAVPRKCMAGARCRVWRTVR
jgi:hypothetical protein